jgi:hypothetical protein
MQGFKLYTRKARSTDPRVVIRKNGQIGFNAGAIAKYDLDMYDNVKLFISDDKQRVAVQFTNDKNKSELIPVQKRPGNFAFSCIPFLNIYDFDWSETVNYEFIWNDKERTAIFRPRKVEVKVKILPKPAPASQL